MQLYRIITVNLLIYGVPAIPSYLTYKIAQPFINSTDALAGQIIAVTAVFIVLLIANYMIFWEKYYHKYLTEDPPSPPKKWTKNEKTDEKMI